MVLSGNEEQAKELVQEAFYRIIKKWDRFDPSQSLENWFYAILRNIYVDSRRSFELRNIFSLDVDAPEEDGEVLADVLPDERDEEFLSLLERRDAVKQVRRAMAALPREQRAILSLADIKGMDYKRIGEVLGLNPGTVRSRIFRARDALRSKFLEKFEEEALSYAM